ncbi:hypothetical protein D9M68_236280 [compost metagenome]
MVGRQQDRRQHVVEVVRDAAGERAHSVHLLGLRHLVLERLLLGDFKRMDDCRFLWRLIALVDHGVDIEAEVALAILRVQRIDRRDVTLPVLGCRQRLVQTALFGFVHHGFDQRSALDVVLRDEAGEELQERRVGAQNPAFAIDGGDRHRRVVEEAREPHCRARRRLLVVLAAFARHDDGAAFAGCSVTRRGDAVDHAHRQALAVQLAQIEVEHLGLLQARLRLHGLDERQPLAGHQVADADRAWLELGQVDAEPIGERGVDVEDLALAPGGEEAGRRVVEIVDGVLQFLEEAFLVVALRRNVGNLPEIERIALAVFERQNPRLQPEPMGAGAAGGAGCQRLQQAEFLMPLFALVQTVRQPIDRFRRLAIAREDGFQRLDAGGALGTRQRAIGGVGVDDPALAVGDDRAVLMGIEKGARQFVRARLRLDLDEADDGGDEEEDADHGKNAEDAENDLVFHLVLEDHEGDG